MINFPTRLNLAGPILKGFLQNFFYLGDCDFNDTKLKPDVGVWFY